MPPQRYPAIISTVFVVMLCIGLGILFIPFLVVGLWYSDSEAIEAVDSTLMASTLPTLAFALLILGLIGLGIHSLLKNKLDLRLGQR
jgi:hypothetical protein